jgi:hypothetical protein
MPIDTKKYLEYLDKEMTIMGILSAVSIAAPAGILNALLGDKSIFKDQLLGAGPFFVMLGSVSCILAALSFYGERSRLAWYYGQICLTEALDSDASDELQVDNLMLGADSWGNMDTLPMGVYDTYHGIRRVRCRDILCPQHAAFASVHCLEDHRACLSILDVSLCDPAMACVQALQL